MAIACPIDLDTARLRQEIQAIYARVATEPSGEFHFHRGPAYAAEMLGYEPHALAALPAEATASFAGVANPHRIAAIAPAGTVVDIGCGAGMDLLLAAKAVGPTGRAIGIDMTESMVERARAGGASARFDAGGSADWRRSRPAGRFRQRQYGDLERRVESCARQGACVWGGLSDPRTRWSVPLRRHHRGARARRIGQAGYRFVDGLNRGCSAGGRAGRPAGTDRVPIRRHHATVRSIPRHVEGARRTQVRRDWRERARDQGIAGVVASRHACRDVYTRRTPARSA